MIRDIFCGHSCVKFVKVKGVSKKFIGRVIFKWITIV